MEIVSFFKKWYQLVFLILIISFHGINNWIWINNNNTYYHIDEYYHLTFSNKIYKIIFSNENELNPYKLDFITNPAFYQRPLMPLITAIFFYPIFGVNANVAIMTNILFLAVLVFSTYAIGKKIYNKNTGLVAAFLVSMYPIIFGISRYYTYFIGLTAILSLSIYLLLLSDKFKNRKYSILFGISSGIGLLINIFFAVYAIGPILYVIFSSIRNLKKNREKIFSNIIIAFLLCLSCAGIWYIYSMNKYNYFNDEFKTFSVISKTIFSVKNSLNQYFKFFIFSFTYYLEKLIDCQIMLPFFILFCIGLFFYIKQKKKDISLILWIVIPYLLISIKFFKTPTYVIPILPAIAILSSFWIFETKNKTLQKLLVIFVVIFGFTQFFIITYTTFLSELKMFGFKVESYTNPPLKLDWKEKEILTYMINNSDKYPVSARFLRPSYNIYVSQTGIVNLTVSPSLFNPISLDYYATVHELPVDCISMPFSDIKNITISSIDFLLIKSENLKGLDETEKKIILNNFYPVKNFSLPYNNEIMILKNMNK